MVFFCGKQPTQAVGVVNGVINIKPFGVKDSRTWNMKVFVYMGLWKEGDKFEMGLKTKVFRDYSEAAAELQADAKEAITCFSMEYGDGNYDYTCNSSDHALCEVNTDEGWLGDRWEAWIDVQEI